ncbi:hypothetical protein [Mesorhizobium erdmanii]|uniref:Uncharacterized protein n=1 Tax=Mesorhizobium erdmanii TaxID=1777866 RepID=A0A6M7UKM5_9HYPH|nr:MULTISPECIES: hypothetical protein [Mesorhizobium]OBQ74513.1 hypothetical protein A8146_01765 [Mesorhizobium loti]QKC76670.1 hypothetical protein EB233_15090 [Mesorhizobium erdmanii]
MDRPAMASVYRMRHAPATVSGVRSTGQGQADPVIRVNSLGEAIRFLANAFPNYDISTAAVDCGDPSIPRLDSLDVKAVWREYGEQLTRE